MSRGSGAGRACPPRPCGAAADGCCAAASVADSITHAQLAKVIVFIVASVYAPVLAAGVSCAAMKIRYQRVVVAAAAAVLAAAAFVQAQQGAGLSAAEKQRRW